MLTGIAAPSFAAENGEQFAMNSPSQTPLMVIRYNQSKVFYQRQLYNAVSRAVSIKPGVMFEVVSFVPSTGDSGRDEVQAARADQQMKALLADMNQIGVPAQRIHATREAASDAKQHEIYIYVD